MRFVASSDGPFRVAFAISTSTGSAVTRNRGRRRIRAILADLDRADALPSGACLIGLNGPVTEHTFDQLTEEVTACLARVSA
jgi:ribonuclease P protein component